MKGILQDSSKEIHSHIEERKNYPKPKNFFPLA
jgi:hypothetical protein